MKILHYNHLTDSYTIRELHPKADIYPVYILGEQCFLYPISVHRNRVIYELRHYETGLFLGKFAGRKKLERRFVSYWRMFGNVKIDKYRFANLLAIKKGYVAINGIAFPINT